MTGTGDDPNTYKLRNKEGNGNYTELSYADVMISDMHFLMYIRSSAIGIVPPHQPRWQRGQVVPDPMVTGYTWIWGKTKWPTRKKINKLRRAIRKVTAVTGSDGSLKYGNGGSRWKLEISKGWLSSIEIQRDVTLVDIAPKEQFSTRCELQGILAWMAPT